MKKESNRPASWIRLITTCTLLFVATCSHAANSLVWSGGAGGNWNNIINWFNVAVPANGDTVVFPGAATTTNNISNLTLNQIRFLGSNNIISGYSFTLTNSILATNNSGGNTIQVTNITLATGDVLINVVSNAASLTIGSALLGTVGVVKTGPGTLAFKADSPGGGGQNSYTGTTTVNAGLLTLSSPAANAGIGGGPLVIGDGSGTPATVQLVTGEEIPDTSPITINRGLLDLNGHTETVTNITLVGGVIANANPLVMAGDLTVLSNSVSSIIGGSLFLPATRTISVPSRIMFPDLLISAAISGAPGAGINQTGPGYVTLSGANTFTGPATLSGFVTLTSDTALGATGSATNGTTVNFSAYLLVEANVGNEFLTLNSGDDFRSAGTAGWGGPITLAGNVFINPFSGTFTNSGAITGPGGFTKGEPGTLIFSGAGANTYSGPTFVLEGILQLAKSVAPAGIVNSTLTIGDNIGGTDADVVREMGANQIDSAVPITINSSGLLDLNNFSDAIAGITFSGGHLSTGTGTATIIGDITANPNTNNMARIDGNISIASTRIFNVAEGVWSPDLRVDAAVTGAGGILKTNTGEMSLTASNSYTGLTTVSAGLLDVLNSFALGATTSGTVVSNGAILILQFGVQVGLEPLTLNGPGAFGIFGALDGSFGSNSWAGPITLGTNSTVSTIGSTDFLNLSGPINGAADLTQIGPGTVIFGGGTANSFNNLFVNGGTNVLNKSVLNGAGPTNIIIGDGLGTDVLQLAAGSQIADSTPVHIAAGGVFDVNDQDDIIGSADGAGTIDLGAGTLRAGADNSSSTFTGLIVGTGQLLKYGLGTWTLAANNTYTGPTTVSAGTLAVNGSQPQSAVTVNPTATLKGSGTVGTLFVFGNLQPGNGPGMLTCSNESFVNNLAGYFIDLTGPNAGTDYDQLNVRGTNGLAGATLHVTPAFTSPVALGQQFTIINNDLSEAINGTFNGLPEGSGVTGGNYKFTISYVGGTGNDVVLTLTNIPGAAISSTVTAGNGSHGIDPSSCNNLALVITNTTGTSMTGIKATLSTTTFGVVVSQPYATYANIPAHGTGSNIAPFQISTLPFFSCGNVINLQLSVDSSLGSFTMSYVLKSGEVSAVPSSNSITGNVAIPDPGAMDSTNLVSGFSGVLAKVVVSLFITHGFDSNLTNISLISPDGTTVLLSSANGGGGANYGSALTPESSRTTFDDAAPTSITAGTAPFVGTFQPQSPLLAFFGNGTPNGNWHLHMADGVAGNAGTLRGWTLYLYSTTCATGSGACDYCLTSITGTVTNTDLVQTGRISRDTIIASCGAPKGAAFLNDVLTRHYDIYAFTNTTADDACVTMGLSSPGDLQAIMYLNSFAPGNITSNFLVDAGGSSTGNNSNVLESCSASIPPGAKFFVTVNEITPNLGSNYVLQISGLPCPPPTLNIQPVTTNNARIYWDTSAGGYLLESVSNLNAIAWGSVTNEPIVSGGNYVVTNSTTLPVTNRFYRLHQP